MGPEPDERPSFQTALDQLLPRLVDEVKAGWKAMFLAGLLYMAIEMVLVLVVVFIPYVFAAPGGIVMITVYPDASDPPLWLMFCTLVPAFGAMIAAMFFVLCVGEPGMRGAILRALDVGPGEPLTWRAPTRSFRVNLWQQGTTMLAVSAIAVLLLPLLILPSILFSLAALFALPAAALDGLDWRAAIGRSIGSTREYLGYHAGIVAILMVIAMIGGAIPFLGQAFSVVVGLAWIRLAYRHRFPAVAAF